MKIAIIGGGISGLTVAYRLSPHHEITLFEANGYVGGHTNTVDVEVAGERQSVDTGFIVFNDWTYPNFIQLLDELGVQSRATCMSFSVRCDRNNLEYNGTSLNGLFAQRRNLLRPSFYRMLRDILRFNRTAEDLVYASANSELTVGEFLARHNYSREFSEQYLLPMGAAIWSCPLSTFETFPIRFIVEFYRNHGLLSVIERPTWRVIEGGSRAYVLKMTQRFQQCIRLNTPVHQVKRTPLSVIVTPKGKPPEQFDHVVFACHSDQAMAILGDKATLIERDVLSHFPYGRNTAVLHTDPSVLPRRKRAWASWNYRIGHDVNESIQPATVTYQMNILQHLRSRHLFNVTLNSEAAISPEKVLRRFEYHHPIFTVKRAAAQSRHAEMLDVNRSSFCGAYWGNGFHEDGVVSAIRVCDALVPVERER